MDVHEISAGGKSSLTIHSHGAHITSWKSRTGREMIYTSPTAVYNGKKAIRGGIPICFPQFAQHGPLQQHGFARNVGWKVDAGFKEGCAVRFVLTDSEESRMVWAYKFEARLIARLLEEGDRLEVVLEVENLDEREFSFTTALHSYFTCDAESVALEGFDGLSYADTADAGKGKVQSGEIVFGKEVDRVYANAPNEIEIAKAGLKLRKENLPDAVVWNPYKEKAAALSDMPDEGWREFVCIEPARVNEKAVVMSGETWRCQVVMMAV